MASFTIDQLRSLPDYALTTRWDINFVTLPAVGALGGFLGDTLNFRCSSVTLPKSTNEKFEVGVRGFKTRHTGIQNYESTMTLTFNETVDNTIFNFVKAWRELIWSSRQGSSFSKEDVEATLLITLLDNQDAPRAKYTVYGCFLEDSDFGELVGEGSEAQKATLTLSVDHWVDSPLSL
jgi:hypothetical protein